MILAPFYWAVWGLGILDRFILMLHCTSHRSLFVDRRINAIIPWVIGPFFGQTPESYFVHHMGMHHPENNLAGDFSTTMPFHRDRFSNWLRYLLVFLSIGLFQLGHYHYRARNRKLLQRLMLGELAFWAVVALLCTINLAATLIVFVLPTLAVRTLMLIGNWGQHAFVDLKDPGNPYRNNVRASIPVTTVDVSTTATIFTTTSSHGHLRNIP